MFFKRFIYVFLISLISFQSFANELLNFGDSSYCLTPKEEKELGQQFMMIIRNSVLISRDPIINNYVNVLGRKLVENSIDPSKKYHFFVINDIRVNAFSGPDGYIGVNGGLILEAQNEGELAAVLAHEIAHVSEKHIARFISDQKNVNLSQVAAMLVSIALGVYNPSLALGVMTAANAGSYQHSLNFLRAREREADRIGIKILTKSGYDARSMTSFFKRLAKINQLNETSIPKVFLTHPETELRLADAYNRIEEGNKKTIKDNLDFYLVQSRIEVLFRDNRNKFIKDDIKNKYANVLALIKTHDLVIAEKEIDKLINKHPNLNILKITKADIYAELHREKSAESILESLYNNDSNDYSVFMKYSDFLVRHEKYKKAFEILEPHYDRYDRDENYLELFSRASGLFGNLVKAYQVRAQICMLYGDKKGAKEQLKMALKFAKDNLSKNQINKRLKDIS